MLNIPESVKTLCKGDGVRKNFRARFPQNDTPDITNSQVVQESVRFTESICSQDVLKFGLTEASMIEFETVGVGNLYGMWMECFTEVDVSRLSSDELSAIAAGQWDGELVAAADSDIGWPFYRIPYGRFRVESCPRNQQAMTHRRVTAYSVRPSDLFPGEDMGLSSCIYPEIRVDMAALTAALDKGTMEAIPQNINGPKRCQPRGIFYDKQVQGYYVGQYTPGTSQAYYTANRHYSDPWLIAGYDFLEVRLIYDKNAYEAAGKQVAQALTDAGYVLNSTYSGSIYKFYKDNEEALRDKFPELFAPTISATASTLGTDLDPLMPNTSFYAAPVAVTRLVNNKLIPLLGIRRTDEHYDPGDGADPIQKVKAYAFEVDPQKKEGMLQWELGWFSGEVTIELLSAATDPNGYFDPSGAIHSVTVTYPPVTVDFVMGYRVQEYSEVRAAIKNSGDAKGMLAPIKKQKDGVKRYSYEGAAPLQDILDGWLELNAAFGKSGRGGGLEMIRLSVDNPVAVAPGEYQSFWWDEYEVEPIGTVTYKFKDKKGNEQEGRYRFGPGASVYSMTDNAALQMLTVEDEEAGKAEDAIKALLDARFIPHLLPIAFTPIDLTMQGLPYLEDGDYLSVTAGDGTAAVSFNMRHELSGIQLQAGHVTSVAGQIIADDGEVYGG